MTFLFRSRQTAANRRIIDRLNDDIVEAVRQRAFYQAGAVPDTFNGRFELLVLHGGLLVARMKRAGEPGPQVAQDLVDTIFRNLDPALRELGVGDMAVPKRMKRLAEAFIGRSLAYDAALASADQSQLEATLSRNIYGGSHDSSGLASYVRAASVVLARSSLDDLLNAPVRFPDAAAFLAEDTSCR